MSSEPLNDQERWPAQYYQWALERTLEEFESGFPLLSKVLGRSAFKLRGYAGSLEPAERLQLARALVKRFNRAALKGGGTLQPREQALIDEFLTYGVDESDTKSETPAYGSARERLIVQQIDAGTVRKGDRRSVRKMVTAVLSDFLDIPVIAPSGIYKYEIHIGEWRLRTMIDYGGNYGQITYSHSLIPEPKHPLQPPIHICGWMGIAGETRWDTYSSEQESEAADGIVTLISTFVKQWAPALVDCAETA